MRGESPRITSVLPLLHIRPYYIKVIKCVKHQNDQNMKIIKWWKMVKCEMPKMWKTENGDYDLPLRIGGVDFGLRIGSRGTPWNSKSAGPGGSENAKCRFCPFKWHFGLFREGSILVTFFDHFLVIYILSLFHFLHFMILLIFVFFHFLDFVTFLLSWFFVNFCHFLLSWMIFDSFLCLN